MDALHIMPSAMTSEMFYDVTNAIYPHVPTQSSMWHHPPSFHHVVEDPTHTMNNNSSPLASSMYNLHSTNIVSSDDHKVNVDSSRLSTLTERGEEFIEVGRTSESSRPVDPCTSPPQLTKTDCTRGNGWSRSQEENDTDDAPDTSAKDANPSGDNSGSAKESQVTSTLKWLSDNYELSEGVCLPRCVLYVHYLDFCKRQAFKPAGAATFGKLIRQKFKNITTRRLGTRGQSKYHYYGIGIKESSIYYQSVYTGKGLTRFSGIKIKTEGTSRKYSLGSKTGTLLPDFPGAHNLILPRTVPVDKMDTFIMMYRTHSQRILDTVISANFEEIQNLLIHFWQGYPQHLVDVLQLPVTVDVVALCDSILYKVLIDVLIPSTIQDIPESLSSDVRAFLKSLPHWIDNSLGDFVPESVRLIKSRVVHNFLRSMKRQLAFVKMGQTARPHLTNTEVTTQALSDLDLIDLDQMCLRTGFALNDKTVGCCDKAVEIFSELKSLLRKQSPVESLTEWLDNLIDKNVLQDEMVPTKLKQRASRFLLHWTMFGALIMKDLTLNNAKSFSFLHLIKMTLDEYVFLVMETQTDKEEEALLQRNLQMHMKNAEEIKTNAKVRTQANRLQNSPKSRKRKTEESELPAGDVEGEIEVTTSNQVSCQSSFQTSPTSSSSSETLAGTAFSRPPPTTNPNLRDTVSDNCTTAVAIAQANEVLRPSTITPHSLPISPIKHYPSFERPAYLSSFGLNSYTDYLGHSNTFPNPRHVQAFPDHHHHHHHHHHTPSQAFPSMAFNPTLNPTSPAAPPPSYWTTPESRSHPSSLTADAYTQFTYNTYQQPYDPYKKSSLLRTSVYHQDSLVRPTASALDGFPLSNFEGLARAAAPVPLDGLARHNPSGLDGLGRSGGAFDPSSRSSVSYYTRPHDPLQVGSSFSVGPYNNGFMDMPPPSGQYGNKDGLLYQDDVYASNMAAASGLAGFGKSYITSGLR